MIADAYAPSWTATVDGRPRRLWATDVALMGLPVARGRRTVDVRLDRTSFWIGAAISLAACGAVAGLVAVGLHRRRGPRRA